MARMSHALSLLLADRKLVSFPARSSDNIEPERCSDSFVRDWPLGRERSQAFLTL